MRSAAFMYISAALASTSDKDWRLVAISRMPAMLGCEDGCCDTATDGTAGCNDAATLERRRLCVGKFFLLRAMVVGFYLPEALSDLCQFLTCLNDSVSHLTAVAWVSELAHTSEERLYLSLSGGKLVCYFFLRALISCSMACLRTVHRSVCAAAFCCVAVSVASFFRAMAFAFESWVLALCNCLRSVMSSMEAMSLRSIYSRTTLAFPRSVPWSR